MLNSNYSMDFGVCIFCGNCVEYCPKNCLSMTEEYELSTYETQLSTYVLASSSVLVRRRKGRIAAVGHKRLAYWLDGMIYRILNFISNKV